MSCWQRFAANVLAIATAIGCGSVAAQDDARPNRWTQLPEPATLAAADQPAARGEFRAPAGFRVEKLFTVPNRELGSWVAIGFDGKGRLIASDQAEKGLCRISLPPIGSHEPTQVERIDLPVSGAQGILWAFDSLYLSVNGGPGSGLYRARDTDGDDRLDQVVKLKDFRGGGEHGPHALRLTPDGKSIIVVCGNHTDPVTPLDASRVPSNWQEDLLLPRQWDANGHAVGKLAPGGWVARTDPDGRTWEMLSIGYRNAYDMAYNAEGDLFVYDSDMEWDLGMPWYRPTRAVHATSGSEFGWRSGTGCWPSYYADSLPPMLEIGPGSPVGVTFGYGLKAPARYQKALLLCDWTFGTIYALQLEPEGSTYKATKEEFLSRTPLPITDAAVGPDGALYFTIGGRGAQSELYRVVYEGAEDTSPAELTEPRNREQRELRRRLEAFHQKTDKPEEAVALAVSQLGHADRFVRYAARVALEHQPVALWEDKVLALSDPEALITGVIGLAHQAPKEAQPALLAALGRLDLNGLDPSVQLDLLRAYELVFTRLGRPDPAVMKALARRLDASYPSSHDLVNRELCNLLVYLESPTVVSKTLALLAQERPRTAEAATVALLERNATYGSPISRMLANQPDAQGIHYVLALRNVKSGWTLDQRKAYFGYLARARQWSGGASYMGFLRNIDREALENASEAERQLIAASGARDAEKARELPAPIGPGQVWTLEAVVTKAKEPLRGRNFQAGKRAFEAAQCVNCHRFAGDGGATGPDLTQVAGRFGIKDLAEAIVDPSKVVSDQYRAVMVATRDGLIHTGRIINDAPDSLWILTDPVDPSKIDHVLKKDIEESEPSQTSLMPDKLLDALNSEEVLDLIAFLLSRGDPSDPMFRESP